MNITLFEVRLAGDKLLIVGENKEFYLPDSTRGQIESWLVGELSLLAKEYASALASERPWRKQEPLAL